MKTLSAPALGMVLKGYPRISETFISNEILALEAQGFRVVILSMRHPRENFCHESVKRIQAPVVYLPTELLAGLWRTLPALAFMLLAEPTNFRRALSLLRQRLADSSRPHITIKHFLQGAYAARAARKHGVGHLHAHFAHSPTSVASFAAAFAGLEFSFTGHAKDVWTQDPAKLAPKLTAAKFAVTCTRANLAYLHGLNGSTPLDAVYHGIDLKLFTFQPKPEPPTPPFRILSVARLTGKKGLDTVLRALAVLHANGLDFNYILIGAGEDKDALQALASDLGIAGRVEFRGVQPHDMVLDELAKADAFVLGCRVMKNGDRDGIPNVLVEAMATGIPVAATTVSALPELVTDETGLLVPPDDPAVLAEALTRLLTDAELRARIIPAARAKVEQDFDVSRNALNLGQIFRTHLGW